MSDLKRLTLNLSTKLVEDVDAYASEMGVSRTAAISFLINSSLKGINLMAAVEEERASTISSKKTPPKKRA